MSPRRPLVAATAVVALLAAAALASGPSGASPAQQPGCSGVVVTATVSAASLPGGAWGVDDVCVEPDAVYEAGVLGVRVVGGLGVAEYRGGHLGRIAFAVAELGEDRSAALVAVEDVATDTVVWSYAEGSFDRTGAVRTVRGDGLAAPNSTGPVPTEPSSIELSITGQGTDLATAEGEVAEQLRAFIDQATEALSG